MFATLSGMGKKRGRKRLPASLKMGRPVMVRLTPAQHAQVGRQAREGGYPSVAAYLRAQANLEPSMAHGK